MEDSERPPQTEDFHRRQLFPKIKRKIVKLNQLMIHLLLTVPQAEKFERYYYRMKENKAWLKDVRNRSSYRAIVAHLRYCQEDFLAMVQLQGEELALRRTKGWDPRTLTAGMFFQPPEPAPTRREVNPYPPRVPRNRNSRHPRNINRNREWRTQIYQEMTRMARSLQGYYQHLEQGKIAHQQRRQMDMHPEDRFPF